MAIERLDPTKVGSSGYWLQRLGKELDDRRRKFAAGAAPTSPLKMAMFEQYYRGDQPLAFASAKFQEAFGTLFKAFAIDICGVIVDSLTERIDVQGIRMAKDQPADDDAWEMWQRNDLDAESRKAFRTTSVTGEVNWLVGPGDDGPLITVEDPLESVVVVNNRRRVVALKRWYDAELDRDRAFVYYPDRIEKFWRRPTQLGSSLVLPPGSVPLDAWEPQAIEDENAVLEHQLGVVPMVPMPNKPNLHGIGESDLLAITPIQDVLNKVVTDMIVASEFGAYRQRWAIGIDMPRDENGNPDTLVAAVSRLWNLRVKEDWDRNRDVDPKVGEFEPTDLSGYIDAAANALQMAATIARMPPHYLISSNDQQAPSGETLRAAEAGLSSKARDRARDFADPLEEVFRLGFLIDGDTERAKIRTSQIIWKDPETRTEAEHVDALGKLAALLDVPKEMLWERYGFSPQEIERIKDLKAEELRRVASGDPLAAEADVDLLGRRVELFGQLIRAGATPDSAANIAGLRGLQHTGLEPMTVQELGDYSQADAA